MSGAGLGWRPQRAHASDARNRQSLALPGRPDQIWRFVLVPVQAQAGEEPPSTNALSKGAKLRRGLSRFLGRPSGQKTKSWNQRRDEAVGLQWSGVQSYSCAILTIHTPPAHSPRTLPPHTRITSTHPQHTLIRLRLITVLW